MRDDENLDNEEGGLIPEAYWTEAQWEKHMLENEKLMDQYQKVWDEDPERQWKDPSDLYMKVHYGLDLGKDIMEPVDEEAEEEAETIDEVIKREHPPQRQEKDDDDADDENISDDSVQSFRKIEAYKSAFELAFKMMDLLKKIKPANSAETALLEQFSFHSFRIAADIAGGHGLGYEEDTLCGNIVKNRWALAHAEQASKLLETLQLKYPKHPEWVEIQRGLREIGRQLTIRIAELRAKVWWEK